MSPAREPSGRSDVKFFRKRLRFLFLRSARELEANIAAPVSTEGLTPPYPVSVSAPLAEDNHRERKRILQQPRGLMPTGVCGIELPRLDALRARRPKRLPSVLSPEEVRLLLDPVRGGEGMFRLMAGLCYGSGLRREECCRVRFHDVDMARQQIMPDRSA